MTASTLSSRPHWGLVAVCLCLLATSLAADDATPESAATSEPAPAVTTQAERVLEPGEVVLPHVRLTEDGPYVLWDADEVDDFNLVDQTGAPVTRETLLGKPWIVNFIFCRCVVQCPFTSKRIKELSEELKDVDVRFVTITVDPEYDTVDIMRENASIYGAKPERWLFCTGEPDEVWKLIRKGFKVSAWEEAGTRKQPGMEFAHSNHLIHVDAEGKIRGRYDGADDLELITLQRVLRGEIETPERHRPVTQAQVAEQERVALVKEFDAQADPLANLPGWAKRLPRTNAMLNGLCTILLLIGFMAIKAKREKLHKQVMLTAFGVSILFLASYLTYHWALGAYTESHGKSFTGTGTIRTVYFAILISHVILAAVVPVGAIVTIRHGLKQNWPAHRAWAKVTFPIWLYVSVTGVIIYWMLYQMA